MAGQIELDGTSLTPREIEALGLWIKNPNYSAASREMGVSHQTARRWVLSAVEKRLAEILPNADEYLTLVVGRYEVLLRETAEMLDSELPADTRIKTINQERLVLQDLIKLFGLAKPEKHLVGVVTVRELTAEEQQERVAKLITMQPLLEDDAADR